MKAWIATSAAAPRIFGIGCVALAMILLEIAIRGGLVSPFVIPLPSDVALAFERVVLEEDVLRRFLVTAGEALAACLMLAVVGITAGVLLYHVRLLRLAIETWVASLAAAPLVLMYPLFLVVFGRNAWAIIMIGFATALPPVILKTLEGFSGTKTVLINVGRVLNLTPLQMYWKILLPSALPSIFVGVRLGMIFALINIVGVEFLINFGGLGQLVSELSERFDIAATYAAICFVMLISIIFFVVTERIEQWLRPGH